MTERDPSSPDETGASGVETDETLERLRGREETPMQRARTEAARQRQEKSVGSIERLEKSMERAHEVPDLDVRERQRTWARPQMLVILVMILGLILGLGIALILD